MSICDDAEFTATERRRNLLMLQRLFRVNKKLQNIKRVFKKKVFLHTECKQTFDLKLFKSIFTVLYLLAQNHAHACICLFPWHCAAAPTRISSRGKNIILWPGTSMTRAAAVISKANVWYAAADAIARGKCRLHLRFYVWFCVQFDVKRVPQVNFGWNVETDHCVMVFRWTIGS
jgi:hypothetical protein